MNDRREVLLRFFSRFFAVENVQDDADLMDMGFINSLISIQLVSFLEDTFHIRVEAEDMDPDNFNSIRHILEYVERKQGGAAD